MISTGVEALGQVSRRTTHVNHRPSAAFPVYGDRSLNWFHKANG
jgi:hypothetical protein